MKTTRPFLLALGLLLILFSAAIIFNFMLAKTIWSLENFTVLSRYTALTIAALFFLIAIWGGSSGPVQEKDFQPEKQLRAWWVGFIPLVTIAIGLILHVDPHARFGGDIFPPVTPDARTIKTELYRKMTNHPDIVILGSSRAFTISPMYIEEKTGYDAFNMSVEGGRVGDFAIELNYIIESGASSRVLLVEVAAHSFGENFMQVNLQPMALIPYMPYKTATRVAENSLQDTFSLQSISDSIFILVSPTIRDQPTAWTFDERGMGVSIYLESNQPTELPASGPGRWLEVIMCEKVDARAKTTLKNMIEVAAANDMAVVFYESPVRSSLYKLAFRRDAEGTNACQRILHTYLASLSKAYPNAFFVDLSDYKTVGDLEEAGFYDAIHIKPVAANLVVDALVPTIEKAMAWALQESAK